MTKKSWFWRLRDFLDDDPPRKRKGVTMDKQYFKENMRCVSLGSVAISAEVVGEPEMGPNGRVQVLVELGDGFTLEDIQEMESYSVFDGTNVTMRVEPPGGVPNAFGQGERKRNDD